jgi:porphobilinogen deaminase
MTETIRIATRGSALALAQARMILARCQAAFPGRAFEVVIIKTTGDKMQTASLSSGDLPKGLFTKELEVALLDGQADIAVHSLKDLPTELPDGLVLGAVTERADVRDVLVYRHIEHLSRAPEGGAPVLPVRRGFKPEVSVAALPHRAVVGTSSTRRAAQLRERRPDLEIVPLRGNVGTRLRKLADQRQLDAIVLAAAGLDRLGFQCVNGGPMTGDEVPEGLAFSRLPLGEMLPCVGQAAIGLEIRARDPRLDEVCARINHAPTLHSVTAERSYLSAMGGGCHAAVAAFARTNDPGTELSLQVVSYLGQTVRRASGQASIQDAAALGQRLAAETKG